MPAPATSQLGRDTTRYRAEVRGAEPSPAIKLSRRLNITAISRNGDTVTVKGAVAKPFADKNES